MKTAAQSATVETEEPKPRRTTKKDQIVALYLSGITEVEDLALITHSRPSYVAGFCRNPNYCRVILICTRPRLSR
jgi:hypothetical protein